MREDAIAAFMEEHILNQCGVPGCDLIVTKEHRVLYRHTCGLADREAGIPLLDQQLYYLYSTTKPITVTAALRLYEAGRLDLDAPVAKYLPAFSRLSRKDGERLVPVATPLTVRHLFTMTGGFDYDVYTEPTKAVLAAKGPAATTRDIADSFARKPLHFEPGSAFQYSICHDILAAVVEMASGQRFSDYVKAVVLDPLGMTDTTFDETPAVLARMPQQYLYQDGQVQLYVKRNDLRPTPAYESGGAGLISSVADYSIFADAMACGGVSKDGYRLLKPETLRLLASEQLSGFVMNNNFSCVAGPGYGYGMGVRVKIRENDGLSPIGEFGWDGAAGCYVLMDPVNQLSIFFGMEVLGWPACIGTAHGQLRDLIYRRFV